MIDEIPTDKRLASIHEAGHAVMAVAKGVPIEHVQLTDFGIDNGWQGGILTGEPPAGSDPAMFLVSEAAMALGGLAAEAVAEGRVCPWSG